MATICKFETEHSEFDFIDKDLIDGTLHCNFPHYNNGDGCPSCPIYKQMIESRNVDLEVDERVQDQIQKWWT